MNNPKPIPTIPPFCEALYKALINQLEIVSIEEPDIVKRCEKSIALARNTMIELHDFIVVSEFSDTQEEIDFFKVWKPKFYSEVIFHLRLLKLQMGKPLGTTETIIEFYKMEQVRIQSFYLNNLAFYQYHRMQAVYLDEQYFRRGYLLLHPELSHHYFNADQRFSSMQDETKAEILANDRLQRYLLDCIEALQVGKKPERLALGGSRNIRWTGSKTALIELIYALQGSGVFNSGAADVKQVADFFQQVLHIELGNYYRVFLDLRIRKNRSAFLDELKAGLEKRMDETDLHPKHLK